MQLRRPWDTLAGCVWLPRFIDKARLHLAGTLAPDFAAVFGHPLATDGAFFVHFGLAGEDIIAAVRVAGDDDDAVAAWFTAQPGCTPERIAAWNLLAFELGKPGRPMERSFRFARRKYYDGLTSDPRVDSVFAGIAWDEGYLDEMPQP